ncbi:phenylalanine aminomutase (D-beta-phenylalanine forming) [Nocardia transvalensis]|uniref:phenylalanine aminomutase (D-beta-phenylalanine forming) n=1 Tax=Nocardia transvalensis TaxID=37333 RepID=UPI001894BC9E|nr:phenylalanine aminomutase (D-beta-phenylalanine forming) [Nocardia transvalensis]MBF6330402.1 phenylalanine aminomutase (D-beta-phenylalanine forming) [Nocardia transvalensis]
MTFTVKLGEDVRLDQLEHLAVNRIPVALDDAVRVRVRASRDVVDRFVAEGRVIYGVNTSLGGFVDHLVPVDLAGSLQKNLIRTAATNVGEYLDETTVRAIMLSRIVSLARGNSGISLDNLDKLVALCNADVVPCVPRKGSLGASGDLGPLAAIALVCIGEWKASVDGRVLPGAQALASAGLEPMELSYKEGLALINGTSGMVGLGALVHQGAQRLVDTYVLVSALSVEGLAAMTRPFTPAVHRTKPHVGQLAVAEKLWTALADSGLAVSEERTAEKLAGEMSLSPGAASAPIEDAYSIRCTPQILGPVVDNLATIGATLQNELNSSNDNPIVLPEDQQIYHNGHFHGQYIAMAMDHLVISLATVTNLANRRVDRFLDKSSSNGLPAFLCAQDQGLRMGLMGGQFMTASVTAETRATSVPMSVQSLTATGDFQDIVSLGLVAARRANEALVNAAYVVAFELLCACQAVDIRGSDGLSSATRTLYERVRRIVPFLELDVPLTDYLEALAAELLTPTVPAVHRV